LLSEKQVRQRPVQALGALLLGACLCAGASARAVEQGHLPIVPSTGALRSANTANFSFIVAGDSRPHRPYEPLPRTPGQIFADARRLKPAFIVWTGDAIFGLDSADPVIIQKQYEAFFRIARDAGAPVFLVPGNHEMDVRIPLQGGKGRMEVGSAQMQALYRKNMALPDGAPLYSAFSYGNSRFILLNSEEIPPPGTQRSPHAKVGAGGEMNLDPGFISEAQFQWLKRELDANKAVHTFIFMHHPIKPRKPRMRLNRSNAQQLMELFSHYSNISYVIASHEHLYYNPQAGDTTPPPDRIDPSKQPPIYLVSGGAGAPLEGTPENGGFHHYLVFQVNGNRIRVRLVKVP
jgi:3',5'-cyclic AMP phosphodiesterase CpdA